jgi:hypothetical protein
MAELARVRELGDAEAVPTSYHAPRRRNFSPEQTAAIRSEAGNRMLHELAVEFGVSHEKVRTTLRTAGATDVGGGPAAE